MTDFDHVCEETLAVTVCFAQPENVQLRHLRLPLGSTVRDAVQAAQFLKTEEIDHYCYGIYNKIQSLETVVDSEDRVEIYCPLRCDAKQARIARIRK